MAHHLLRALTQPAERPGAGVPLTDREREVLRLVAQGLSNDEIAEIMHLGERTVRSHVSHILAKLHLETHTQVALYAQRAALARPATG
jgi:DNA-binding NarL/FixJ family response regulator